MYYFTDVVHNDAPFTTIWDGDLTKRLFETYQIAFIISISGGSYLSKLKFVATIYAIVLTALILLLIKGRLIISSIDIMTLLVIAIAGSR